ncbi:MAG: hypothetical protein ACPGC9_01350 [Cytophagales bacterium]
MLLAIKDAIEQDNLGQIQVLLAYNLSPLTVLQDENGKQTLLDLVAQNKPAFLHAK